MLRSVLITLTVAFSVSVNAQEINYNYVQGSYGQIDIDYGGLEFDGDGPGISASLALGESFFIFGDYQTADMDLDIDFNLSELAVGYHTDISPNLDVYANVGYVRIKADSFFFSSNDDGVSVGLGVRGVVSQSVELFGGINYMDFDDPYDETRVHAGFEFSVTDNIGVGLKAILWDNLNIFQINARLYFK